MIITYIILFILFKNIYSLYSIHQLYKITTLDDVIIYPKFNNINNNIKSLLINCNKYEILYSNYNGKLFEISHNYKIYNYKPYAGSEYKNYMSDSKQYQINNCKGEFVYRIKKNLYKNELSDQIMIKINDKIILYISIINENNIFVSNNFLLDTHNWIEIQIISQQLQAELTNNYNLIHFQQQIISSDHLINLDLTKKYDKSLWYFTLISNKNNSFFKYNLGVCFKSYLIFNVNIFAYENNKIHTSIHNIPFVKLQSIVEIYYPLIHFDITKNTHTIKIKLSPELWFKSVDNSVLSDDEFISVLSNLYKIEILGDLCVGFETVGLSNIMIKLD
jgi:hypothetical protein